MKTKPMTEAQLGALTTAVEGLAITMQPIQVLPPSKRKRFATVGRHREQFTKLALEAGRQFQELLPQSLDLAQAAAIERERSALQALRQQLRHLNGLLEGHAHVLGHASFQMSARIYRVLKASQGEADVDLDGVLTALGEALRQKRGKVQEAAAVTAQ